MDKIFIAFGFNPKDRAIVGDIEIILRSHGIVPDGGEILGGGALDPAIVNKIRSSDGLVAVMTRRQGKQTFPNWVHSELIAANTLGKRAIAIVEKGLKLPKGLYSQNERIDYDPATPLPAFIKLVQTIGEWKRNAGRQLRVILLPSVIGQRVRENEQFAQCEYRFVRNGNVEVDWQPARLSPEVGATLAYLKGAQDDLLIEMRLKIPGETWTSARAPQWTHIELEKTGN